MARKTRKDDFEDDGRTIVPMDVDGMPWSTRGVRDMFREKTPPTDTEKPPMSRDERRSYIWAAVKASLLIGGVFFAGYALFLLFCRFVWFR